MHNQLAIVCKEQMQKQRLYVAYDHDRRSMDLIDEGFSLGREDWRSHLTAMYPEKEVSEFFRAYEGNHPFKSVSSFTVDHALLAKEEMQRQRLYVLFGREEADMNKIDHAFESGSRDWEPHLKTMYSSDEVEALFQIFGKPASSATQRPVPN